MGTVDRIENILNRQGDTEVDITLGGAVGQGDAQVIASHGGNACGIV
ncbi:hypothetical protein DSLASN_18170 [Desulfoluna limicola]|uniref:Uncharacterized protein n=1 Tax=Desulfoluna limicola TaxID=2810562 RepID=A0ABM7PF09_9BACT|nr:hypothetical protein DSLASN_18170 [Desulfoluna limicola]